MPPPLEARVSESVVAQVRQAIGFGVSLGNRLNETLRNEETTERAALAVYEALRPGRLPFALLVLLVVACALQYASVRSGTARILREHGHFLRDAAHENGRDKQGHRD